MRFHTVVPRAAGMSHKSLHFLGLTVSSRVSTSPQPCLQGLMTYSGTLESSFLEIGFCKWAYLIKMLFHLLAFKLNFIPLQEMFREILGHFYCKFQKSKAMQRKILKTDFQNTWIYSWLMIASKLLLSPLIMRPLLQEPTQRTLLCFKVDVVKMELELYSKITETSD